MGIVSFAFNKTKKNILGQFEMSTYNPQNKNSRVSYSETMGYLEDNDFTDAPSIPEFYKGKHIFITGGSGFMGKVLIEKLLYSCKDVGSIFLLLRNKKGVSGIDRLQKLYTDVCFDRLRKERAGIFESKVYVMNGDMMELHLGLSQEDREVLVNKIDIVFHVAASVRFDDPLSIATKMNLRGTRDLIDIAKDMKHLKAFIHVSTCYSNTNRNPVEEQIYPEHASWRDTIDICETLDEETLKILTPKYLGDIPNTYTFTKQLAEHVVYEQRGILPCVIIRPSVVISSYSEPFPGWIDNFNGPIGLMVASGKGVLQSLYFKFDILLDHVSVDHAIRHFIAVGWARGIKKLKPQDDVPIFNCATSLVNSITFKYLNQTGREFLEEKPFNKVMWATGGHFAPTKQIHYLNVLLFQLLPAILVDIALKISGRKPILLKIQRKIYIAFMALDYFSNNQWTFINKNFLHLRELIKKNDCEEFNYFFEKIDNYEYLRDSYHGAKIYLLKEKPEDITKLKATYWRFYYLDKFLKYSIKGYIVWKVIQSTYFNYMIDSIFTTT